MPMSVTSNVLADHAPCVPIMAAAARRTVVYSNHMIKKKDENDNNRSLHALYVIYHDLSIVFPVFIANHFLLLHSHMATRHDRSQVQQWGVRSQA